MILRYYITKFQNHSNIFFIKRISSITHILPTLILIIKYFIKSNNQMPKRIGTKTYKVQITS